MRYQFDMMISSVLSELFRKIFVPAFTGSVKNVGGAEGSIFSSLHNLLRNNRIQQQQQPANLLPTPTSTQTNVDLQKLLDNAQKLITLQAMIRNGGQSNSIDESKKSINDDSHTELNTSSIKKKKKTGPSTSTNKQSFRSDIINNKNSHHQQSNNKNDVNQSNSNNNPISMISNLSNSHSANDFIDFIRNNLKLNQLTNSQNINNNNNSNDDDHQNISGIGPSTSDGKSGKNNIFKDFNINQMMVKSPSLSSDIGHHQSLDVGNGGDSSLPNFSSNIINKLKNFQSPSSSAVTTNDSKMKFKIFKKKAKIEDFKMSHLTFIDTEVPNYGNQLLIKDPDKDGEEDLVDSSYPLSATITMLNHLKSKPLTSSNDHDLERANRWNNVLSSI
nr:uncharacterized protein DDB_G0287625-like [Dermatophagoides farinae]